MLGYGGTGDKRAELSGHVLDRDTCHGKEGRVCGGRARWERLCRNTRRPASGALGRSFLVTARLVVTVTAFGLGDDALNGLLADTSNGPGHRAAHPKPGRANHHFTDITRHMIPHRSYSLAKTCKVEFVTNSMPHHSMHSLCTTENGLELENACVDMVDTKRGGMVVKV